ncbi:hypothetical protein MICRO11B_460005 [Micrococcus luteus]|nr:hypothetical protein MICRO11B_460005 [Micrococcus luteus]
MGVRRAVARDGGAAGDRPPRHRTEARDHVQRLLAGGRPAALIPSDGRRPCSEHEADRTPRNDEGPLRQEGPFVCGADDEIRTRDLHLGKVAL